VQVNHQIFGSFQEELPRGIRKHVPDQIALQGMFSRFMMATQSTLSSPHCHVFFEDNHPPQQCFLLAPLPMSLQKNHHLFSLDRLDPRGVLGNDRYGRLQQRSSFWMFPLVRSHMFGKILAAYTHQNGTANKHIRDPGRYIVLAW
jgi:hypothetical protein